MTQTDENRLPATEGLIGRLDQIAADIIAVRRTVAGLEGRGYDGLRARTDLLLEEVARCIARELDAAGVPRPSMVDQTD